MEFEDLKSQNATSRWEGRRTLQFAFTEQGTVMLASVLESKKADTYNSLRYFYVKSQVLFLSLFIGLFVILFFAV